MLEILIKRMAVNRQKIWQINFNKYNAVGGGLKCCHPLSTSDEALKSPYEQYPVTICGQTIIRTNGELAAALLSLPEKKREIIYLYFFGNYTQQEIGE